MKTKRLKPSEKRRLAKKPATWTPEGEALSPDHYGAALLYLFDRPVPENMKDEWYWRIDEPEFEATPLEWTRIQTVMFANAAEHLAAYDDDQVGMGLNYVMSNALSDVPFAAIDATVPIDDAMRMMRAMPILWRDCIGPRLSKLDGDEAATTGRLGFVCNMWFDVWPTFWNVRNHPGWQEAVWSVLRQMLEMPFREVQVAALHGIGHCGPDLKRQDLIDRAIGEFVRTVARNDQKLKDYAEAARRGCVL